MSSFQQRWMSGVGLVALLLLIAYGAPAVVVCGVLIIVALRALLEFYRLLDHQGIPSFRILGAGFSVALIGTTWASYVFQSRLLTAEQEMFVMFGLVIAILVRQFPQKNNAQPLATMACTLLGFLYVPFLFNYFTKLVFAWDAHGWLGTIGATGRWLVFYLIAVVKCTDVGAFLVGRRWGRHKLIPRLSPAKTWEGVIGGVATGLLVSLVFRWLLGSQFGYAQMLVRDALVLGLLLPVLGIFGDLTESMLKRAAKSKDTGGFIPGMGGLLDILDSLLFAAPLMFVYAKCFLVIS
ncbi:MAG: CDP-archaeol synthase [Lentisphaerae bacterium]|nr:CDP-archaeol synthase [Lentisphaerota bacterium]